MITVVIPGYSVHNKDWVLEASKKIALSHEVRPILWDHWQDPEKKFDAREKANEIIDILLNDTGNIIAKSIGTLVASYMIQKIPQRLNKVIFCGIPLNDIGEEEKEQIKEALRIIPPTKIAVFQNEDDPHGSFAEVQDFIRSISSEITVNSRPGEDHEYPYYTEFEMFFKG